MTHTETTRRGLLGGAGLLATMVAARCTPTPASAATLPASGVSPRLQRLIALRDKAEGAWECFDHDVRAPANEAADKDRAALPPLADIPHQTVATTFENYEGKTVRFSTGMIGVAAIARRAINDPLWADYGDDTWRQAHRELLDLTQKRDDVVQAQLAEREAVEGAIDARHRIEDLEKRIEHLWDREYRLREAAFSFPSASIADLAAKMGLARRTLGHDDAQHIMEFIDADVRRLSEIAA